MTGRRRVFGTVATALVVVGAGVGALGWGRDGFEVAGWIVGMAGVVFAVVAAVPGASSPGSGTAGPSGRGGAAGPSGRGGAAGPSRRGGPGGPAPRIDVTPMGSVWLAPVLVASLGVGGVVALTLGGLFLITR